MAKKGGNKKGGNKKNAPKKAAPKVEAVEETNEELPTGSDNDIEETSVETLAEVSQAEPEVEAEPELTQEPDPEPEEEPATMPEPEPEVGAEVETATPDPDPEPAENVKEAPVEDWKTRLYKEALDNKDKMVKLKAAIENKTVPESEIAILTEQYNAMHALAVILNTRLSRA
jgi:hypothetical protein